MRTPEQIAADMAADYAGNRNNVVLGRDDFISALELAAREAQAEPSFKPEGEPDEYRDAWEAMEGIKDDRTIVATFNDYPEPHITKRNARHILAYLSEQSSAE